MKGALQRLLRGFGYEIRRAQPSVAEFLASRQVDVVLDVGANVGQYARLLRAQGYRGKIVSFEPVRSVYEALARNRRGDPGWSALNLALGEEDGRAEINVAELSAFSSLSRPGAKALDFDSRARVARTETIEVRRLDGMFADLHGRRTFLKIDVQGFEPQVLAGAERSLPQLAGIQLEVGLARLYEQQMLLPETLKLMETRGFRPALLMPVNFDNRDPVRMLEVDIVFANEIPVA